jgi:hypothetical protein
MPYLWLKYSWLYLGFGRFLGEHVGEGARLARGRQEGEDTVHRKESLSLFQIVSNAIAFCPLQMSSSEVDPVPTFLSRKFRSACLVLAVLSLLSCPAVLFRLSCSLLF